MAAPDAKYKYWSQSKTTKYCVGIVSVDKREVTWANVLRYLTYFVTVAEPVFAAGAAEFDTTAKTTRITPTCTTE